MVKKPRPKNETEGFIKQQVKQVLEDTGWTFWMPNAGGFGRSGVSDFLAVKQPGLFMAIETKYDGAVTALQFRFLTDVHDAGHYAFLVDETNIEILRAVLISDYMEFIRNPERINVSSLMRWQNQDSAENLDI